MIRKHQDTATKNKAIVSGFDLGGVMFADSCKIIPQCGLESAPSDLIAWSLVSLIREKLSVGTKDAVATAYSLT